MANQHQNLWEKTPGLHERAVALRGEGKYPTESAIILSKEFKMAISESMVGTHLRRHPELVDAGKGVRLPRELIQPKAGYHEPYIAPKPKHPTGWEPHVEERGDEASAISQPMEDPSPDEETLIRGWNLDPEEWMIKPPINCRRWESPTPVEEGGSDCRCMPKNQVRHHEMRWAHYFKADLIRRDRTGRTEDVSDLKSLILRIKPRRVSPPTGTSAFVVALADSQLGKADGDGTTGTTQRMIDRIERVKDYARDLRKLNVPLGPMYFFGMGDILEACSGFYPQQTFTVQLPVRKQLKLARGLIVRAIKEWAPLFERVVVAAVGGNHGEASRVDGRNATDDSDNHDVGIFEAAEETISENKDAFGHVAFSLPDDQLYQVFDVCGTSTGITHGQTFGNGATVMKKAEDWWKGQALGDQPMSSAKLLLTAHFHSHKESNIGSRTHIQCPAMEGASKYYKDRTGQESYKGMLAMVVGKDMGPTTVDGEHQGFDYKRVL